MSQFETPAALLAAFAAGVSLHVCVFRIGEWDLWAVRIILFFGSLYALAVVGLMHYFLQSNITPFESIKIVGKLSASLMSGLVGSMLLYRGFFHRLCRFPGPVFARFSNLYPTFLSSKNLHLYDEVRALHQQYGDIVRLGTSS